MFAPLLALAQIVLPVLVIVKLGYSIQALLAMPFAIASYPLLREDFRSKKLPNRIIYPTTITTLILIFGAALFKGDFYFFTESIISATLSFVGAFFLYLIARGGFGAGDVKLFLLTGLLLGTFDNPRVIPAAIFSIFGVALYSLFLLITKRATAKTAVAFGPFIIIGTWISIFIS